MTGPVSTITVIQLVQTQFKRAKDELVLASIIQTHPEVQRQITT